VGTPHPQRKQEKTDSMDTDTLAVEVSLKEEELSRLRTEADREKRKLEGEIVSLKFDLQKARNEINIREGKMASMKLELEKGRKRIDTLELEKKALAEEIEGARVARSKAVTIDNAAAAEAEVTRSRSTMPEVEKDRESLRAPIEIHGQERAPECKVEPSQQVKEAINEVQHSVENHQTTVDTSAAQSMSQQDTRELQNKASLALEVTSPSSPALQKKTNETTKRLLFHLCECTGKAAGRTEQRGLA